MPRSIVLTARWLLPIDRAPIAGGWVEIQDGRVRLLGNGPAPAGARDLGDVAIMPGLVNAHTHVELSWLAGRVPPADSMVDWILALMTARATASTPDPDRLAAARDATRAMRDSGTVLVGDISNSLASARPLRDAHLGGVLFHELLGFSVTDATEMVAMAWGHVQNAVAGIPELRPSVVAHAPYSVSPALFTRVAASRRSTPLSVHVAESAEEIEFLSTGRGRFRDLLERLGVWNERWRAPMCDPITYLDRLGYLQPGLLAVHGVHLDDTALERVRDAGATVVTCPRSNRWVGGGPPRISRFYASGVPVAIGTDSLASSESLNLFDEVAEMRRLAPDVAPGTILESATRTGAEALGFGDDYGTIAPGKRAAFVAVRVPPDVGDVEEYLVGGVPVSSIQTVPTI